MANKWARITTDLPNGTYLTALADEDEDGRLYNVRNVQTMQKSGGQWFVGGCYVYYTPTHYQPSGKS